MNEMIVLGSYGTYAFDKKKKPLVWKREDDAKGECVFSCTELLEERAFDLNDRRNYWADSELQNWLNTVFFATAFGEEEQSCILRKKHGFWHEYYAGDMCESQDRVTIPAVGHGYRDKVRKSCRNQLVEGEFKGYWLKNGVKITRVAYVDETFETKSQYGIFPDRKLSVFPVLWLDPEKLPGRKYADRLETYGHGVLLGDAYFYMDQMYVKAQTDHTAFFVYVLNEKDEAVIVGCNQVELAKMEELVFPGVLDGHKVTGILGEYRLETVKKLVMEEGIGFVGEECFVLCPALEEVWLPVTLEHLPSSNFTGCPNLKKIVIPKENPYLVNEEDVVYSKDKQSLIKFVPGKDVTFFFIPDTVKHIEAGAFSDAILWEVALPEGMKEVSPYAFAYADIDRVYLNQSLERMGDYSFAYSKIKRMEVPESVTYIGDGVWEGCRNLGKLSLPKSLEYLGADTFRECSMLKSLRLSEGITALCGTFSNCMCLRQVYIPNSVKLVNGDVFDSRAELTVYGEADSYIQAWAKQNQVAFSEDAFDARTWEKEIIYRSSCENLKQAKVGDVVTFGSYVQCAEGNRKDPVEWQVLERNGNRILVITKDVLIEREYDIHMNGTYNVKWDQGVDWEQSELKGYLNGTVVDELFTEREKQCISDLFCLSGEDVCRYLPQEGLRRAKRTDYNFVRYGFQREAQWWLTSMAEDPDYGVTYMDCVDEQGEIFGCSSNEVHGVRPAMWLDVDRAVTLCYPDNETYIRQWILKNNHYIAQREDLEEYLNLLVVYTVIFEKMAGISQEDILVVEDGKARIVSGPAVTGEMAERILKTINYEYAYVGLERAKKAHGFLYFKYLLGIEEDYVLDSYYRQWYEKTMSYCGERDLQRTVYVIKDKVFYADSPLTEEEMEYIRTWERGSQVQYDVNHEENGIYWW